MKLNNDAENFSETTGIKIPSKYWAGNRKLSMEVITIEYFINKDKIISNVKKMNFIHILVMRTKKLLVNHMITCSIY